MAVSLAKTTLTAIAAAVVSPLTARIDALAAEIAAMRALMAVPVPVEPPAVVTPAPGGLYEVTLNPGSMSAWTLTTAGRTPVQRGLARRYEVPVPSAAVGVGSLRLALDVYPTGWADLSLRNDAAMILDGGPVSLSVLARRDGQEVLRVETGTIHHYSGRIYALGAPVYPTAPSTDELIRKGLVAPYRQGPVTESKLQSLAAVMADPAWRQPGSNRNVTQDMPQTGGRADIGPTTEAQAVYLMSRDPRALAYIIGQAEAAAVIPWHLRDAARGHWLSAQDYPLLWSDGRNGVGVASDPKTKGLTQQMPRPEDTGWALDSAHQPDLSYVPYLLTGRESFRDNALAQAAWNIVNTWEAMRGSEGGMVVVNGGQVRHSAWALRQIDEAAVLAPEGSEDRAYFTAASKANWDWLVSQIPAWTAAQGELAGWLPGDYGGSDAMPLWQQAYLVSTSAKAAAQGNAQALTFLRWQAGFIKGAAKHMGHDACAYLMAGLDGGKPVKTWAEAKRLTVARGWSNGDGWSKSDGNFGQLTVLALRLIGRALDDAEAFALADKLIAEGAPYTDEAAYQRDVMLWVERG